MSEIVSNRKYKDGVFTKLFHDKKRIIELYNALEGTNYDETTTVVIKTLENVLYGLYKNDMAFVIDNKFVVLVEHQSTICNNMPLRMLLYLSRVYERTIDIGTVYNVKQVKIPYPELYVLYNGTDDYPEESEMKLSDSFILRDDKINLELKVKVFNINYGKGKNLLGKSPTLEGYSRFIYTIRDLEKNGMNRDEAINSAINKCIKEGILKEFLLAHGSEVHNMLFAEFNLEKELKVAEEIGMEKGLEKGMEKGMEKGLEKGMEKGMEKGLEKGRAITVVKLLTKKFGTLPEELITKITNLDIDSLEVIIDGIFEFKSLDDVKKYIK